MENDAVQHFIEYLKGLFNLEDGSQFTPDSLGKIDSIKESVNIASRINLQNRIQDTGAEMKEIATKLEISEAQKAKMEAELKNLKQQLEIILKTVSK